MIRQSVRILLAAVLGVLFVPAMQVFAQQHVPPAPDSSAQQPNQSTAPEAPAAQEPSAPAPSGPPKFPPPDPANFTASAPTKDVVDSFLQAIWGFDPDRMWQVQAIQKTQVEGLSRVIILVGDRNGKNPVQTASFLALPDGKHIITADTIMDFGAKPFAATRELMQLHADGPYRGSASKDLELVEFADFQCPHCRAAQANMDRLATDFPKARVVFQNYPIPGIHPEATQAAEYGVCVSRQGGSTAFFQYAAAVFEGQDGLGSPDGATLTLNSAVAKAGLDPTKIAACAAAPDVKASVEASVKFGNDIGINQVPTLVINGRQVNANESYDLLKKLVEYQEKLDGVSGQ